jgi:hypothetical protein
MRAVKAKSFLDNEIAARYRAELPQSLTLAYQAVEVLAQGEPLLEVESARINRGHLRAWAADLAVQRLVTSGKWPFEYDWADYGRPTGKWLRIRLPNSTMSVSQVDHSSRIPRDADFRTNNTLNNMPFLDLDDFRDEEKIRGLPHFILIHGYQSLDFIHIGLPFPSAKKDGYIYKTPNLLDQIRATGDDLPPPEGEDAEAVVELVEELKKWWHDNGPK